MTISRFSMGAGAVKVTPPIGVKYVVKAKGVKALDAFLDLLAPAIKKNDARLLDHDGLRLLVEMPESFVVELKLPQGVSLKRR